MDLSVSLIGCDEDYAAGILSFEFQTVSQGTRAFGLSCAARGRIARRKQKRRGEDTEVSHHIGPAIADHIGLS